VAGRLAGKVALVTGAGGGIGEATAALFWAEGAAVAMVDRAADDLEQAAQSISAAGDRLLVLEADLAQEAEAERVVQATVQHFGGLHVLANIAGVRAPLGPVTEATRETWQRILDVNLLGLAACCKYAIPAMAQDGGGSIINVSSENALVARPGWAIYDASKAAVLALSRDMACDHAAQGIRVNAVCPGFVLTRFHIRNHARGRGISYAEAEAELRAAGYQENVLRRPGEPRELAYALLFLASDESSYVTGAVFRIDGGVVG